MRIVSAKTKQLIRESFQTFVIAIALIAFAILLSFVHDFCVETKRPPWLTTGILVLEVMLFMTDAFVVFAVCARITLRAVKDFWNEGRDG